jgi:hypothetical protein
MTALLGTTLLLGAALAAGWRGPELALTHPASLRLALGPAP